MKKITVELPIMKLPCGAARAGGIRRQQAMGGWSLIVYQATWPIIKFYPPSCHVAEEIVNDQPIRFVDFQAAVLALVAGIEEFERTALAYAVLHANRTIRPT